MTHSTCRVWLRHVPDLLWSQFSYSAVTSRQFDKGVAKPLQLKLIKVAHLLPKCLDQCDLLGGSVSKW